MKKLLLLLFSLILSFNAYGEWTKTSEGVDGDSYYIDFQTIKKLDNGDVVVWIMFDTTDPTDGIFSDDKFYSSKMFWQVGCDLNRFKPLSMTQYQEPMGRGESESLDGIAGAEELMTWQYLPPDSIGYKNIEEVCSIAKSYGDSDFDDVVLEAIAHFDSFDWGDVETTSDSTNFELTEQQKNLQSGWVADISAKVKSNWRYQGAEDDWWCEVYVLQKRNGEVLAVDVDRCQNLGANTGKSQTFKNSLERAVYKSSPLPSAPNDSVFNEEIKFVFFVN